METRYCVKCEAERPLAEWYASTLKYCGSYCRKCYAQYRAEYKEKNPKRKAKLGYATAYDKRRKASDIEFKLRKTLRERMNKALRIHSKSGSAVSDLGCSVAELKDYLASKFQPGMSWDNHGEWHIDHIIPLSSFQLSEREQFLRACHYTNLQPLWADQNLRKTNKL
jgi:hypothetical protein